MQPHPMAGRACEERRGALAAALVVEQPGTRDRGEQIVAVDHLVVVHGLRGTRSVALQAIEYRLLADILLVCDLAPRREPREYRGEPDLECRWTQDRKQQPLMSVSRPK
jgi:hypothetical protein